MSNKYTVDFSKERSGWCVFKALTASIRLFHVKCSCEEEAEHVADGLNEEDEKCQ